ncbi:hypothetical protein SDC9_176148 [bioreactor metagenome]|uniref:Uncharacterized protein n=1 Tax=bioreactor metagenome TaxID=1076179 RepID=A0A645GYK5_9ZZZZ
MDVFQQLGHFGGLGTAHRHQGLDGVDIDSLTQCQALGSHATDDLGNVLGAIVRVAGVFALRAEYQGAIAAGFEPAAAQARGQHFFGGAGPGGGLQDHEHVLVGVLGDGAGGGLHVGHVRLLVVVQRSGNADRHYVAFC